MQTFFRTSTCIRTSICITAFTMLAISGCGKLSLRCLLPSLPKHNSIPAEHVNITNQQSFVNPQVFGSRPNRVVMVASGRSNGSYRTHQKIITELAAQIRGQDQFEIVAPRDRYLQGHSDNILEGKFEEAELVRIAREFNADAVLLIKVNEFRPSPPMRANLSIAILDANESVVAFGMSGVWDLANMNTKQAFEQFLYNTSSGSANEGNLYLQSPNQLFRFIGSQVADSITRSGF